MTDNEYPLTVRDDDRFDSLVAAWKYCGLWDNLALVYDGKPEVPSRLHGFTIIASNNPSEPYGALMQVAPSQAKADCQTKFAGRKLLAKIRLD